MPLGLQNCTDGLDVDRAWLGGTNMAINGHLQPKTEKGRVPALCLFHPPNFGRCHFQLLKLVN